MEINTQNDTDPDNDSEIRLPEPHFDETAISRAQQVEPLDAKGRRNWRPRSAREYLQGRLGALAVIMIALLLGAAAVGAVLGLRDGRRAIDESAMADQATSEPTNGGAQQQPVKAQPVNAPTVKSFARTQPAEILESNPKPISPREAVRRTVQVGLDEIDRALSEKSERARKVGEYSSGRNDRRGRKSESRKRERGDDDHE